MNSIGNSGVSGLFQSASAGIQQGMNNLARDQQAVAGAINGDSSGAMTTALADSQSQKLMVEASARMLKTANDTLGTLIDVTA